MNSPRDDRTVDPVVTRGNFQFTQSRTAKPPRGVFANDAYFPSAGLRGGASGGKRRRMGAVVGAAGVVLAAEGMISGGECRQGGAGRARAPLQGADPVPRNPPASPRPCPRCR